MGIKFDEIWIDRNVFIDGVKDSQTVPLSDLKPEYLKDAVTAIEEEMVRVEKQKEKDKDKRRIEILEEATGVSITLSGTIYEDIGCFDSRIRRAINCNYSFSYVSKWLVFKELSEELEKKIKENALENNGEFV